MGTLYYGDNLDILRRYLKEASAVSGGAHAPRVSGSTPSSDRSAASDETSAHKHSPATAPAMRATVSKKKY